jgi:hypothetical protein
MRALVFTDAGRSSSRRPRQANDCTVRSLALAVGVSYDEAYDELRRRGRKASRGFVWPPSPPRDDEVFGVQLRWVSFPARKGQPRMNTERFVMDERFEWGTWILDQAKHVCVVIDGVVHDDHPTWERCVYGAWEVCGTAANVRELSEEAG